MAAVTLDDSFAALAAFDWGDDPAPLGALEALVVMAAEDSTHRTDLERRFVELLQTPASRAAKEYACRQLRLIGTDASVPHLARLLPDPDLSHMGRFALERIPTAEAGQALRDALSAASDELAIGIISSLAARRDPEAVPLLVKLLDRADPVAAAAAAALGRIGTPAAGEALTAEPPAAARLADAWADARLACAGSLLAAGDRPAATLLYQAVLAIVGEAPTTRRDRSLRMAAHGGLLDCLGES